MEINTIIYRLKKIEERIIRIEHLINSIISTKERYIEIMEGWIPRQVAMEFLGYGDTQMTAIARQHNFITSKIGSRIYYRKESIITALNKNII